MFFLNTVLVVAGFLVYKGMPSATVLTCKVSHSDFDHSNKTCLCGIQCTSHYPCLRIYVNYTLNGRKVMGMLHETSVRDKVSKYINI